MFKDLNEKCGNSRHDEQLRLHTQHSVVATVEDSVLRPEMGVLESQEEDTPKRRLWHKSLGVLGITLWVFSG